MLNSIYSRVSTAFYYIFPITVEIEQATKIEKSHVRKGNVDCSWIEAVDAYILMCRTIDPDIGIPAKTKKTSSLQGAMKDLFDIALLWNSFHSEWKVTA